MRALSKPARSAGFLGHSYNQDILGQLFYVLCIVICDTILSPSCTVRCPGATDSLVLLFTYIYSACVCVWETDRQTETDTETERQRETQTEKETKWQRQKERERAIVMNSMKAVKKKLNKVQWLKCSAPVVYKLLNFRSNKSYFSEQNAQSSFENLINSLNNMQKMPLWSFLLRDNVNDIVLQSSSRTTSGVKQQTFQTQPTFWEENKTKNFVYFHFELTNFN